MRAYIRLIASLHAPTRQGFRTSFFYWLLVALFPQRNKINIWLRWRYINLALKQLFSSKKLGKPSKNKVIPQAPFRTPINVYISRTKLHHLYISKTRQISNLLFSSLLLASPIVMNWCRIKSIVNAFSLLQFSTSPKHFHIISGKTYKCLSQFYIFHLLLLLAIGCLCFSFVRNQALFFLLASTSFLDKQKIIV